MQIRCENCARHESSSCADAWICHKCENFDSFKPKGHKEGRPYHVRVSELRYGEVTVWAASEEDAKIAASEAEINFFDSEITDMTAEPIRKGDEYE